MTFRESEFSDIISKLAAVLRKAPHADVAQAVRKMAAAYRLMPLYPGLIADKIDCEDGHEGPQWFSAAPNPISRGRPPVSGRGSVEQRVTAEAGTCVWVEGPSAVKLLKGSAVAVGGPVRRGKAVRIPANKKIPFVFHDPAEIRVLSDRPGRAHKFARSTIPVDWDKLAGRVYRDRTRVVFILGEMDVGKTFFCTYLANRLRVMGRKVAIVDCDAGQSDIGPPGTFGLSFLRAPLLFLHDAPVNELFFLGSHSPGLHLLHALTGVHRLAQRAREKADTVIIDTTGWVSGDVGRTLKEAKIRLLDPGLIVALQRERELEHLLAGRPARTVARIKVSKNAAPTSPAVRKSLRESLSRAYFGPGRTISIPFSKVRFHRCFLFSGIPIPSKHPAILRAERLPGREGVLLVTKSRPGKRAHAALQKKFGPDIRVLVSGSEKGILTGLLDGKNRCLALGIIDHFDFQHRAVRLFTPVSRANRIRNIVIGSLRYTPDGAESGFVEPGAF